ncbi:MAG TPA: hypothetical protein PK175_03375 [Syntrophales bacterium]|jgi:hypothetical protein|nr:hypothetical protein [Syntrophales bacterium]HON22442.1 hypothetical protein [Syntrophales bacterium]HOU78007.1 hypothetical protein [Syntrophales bacterium]HPC32204.1 hypothetical protein [Syntrophales bacterium]HQG33894.1 hypothetical protein [Syntrophales bacterium]
MIDSAKEFISGYYDQLLNWYDGLTYLEQFFTLFGLFVALAVIIGLYIVKKSTG